MACWSAWTWGAGKQTCCQGRSPWRRGSWTTSLGGTNIFAINYSVFPKKNRPMCFSLGIMLYMRFVPVGHLLDWMFFWTGGRRLHIINQCSRPMVMHTTGANSDTWELNRLLLLASWYGFLLFFLRSFFPLWSALKRANALRAGKLSPYWGNSLRLRMSSRSNLQSVEWAAWKAKLK